MPSYEFSLQDYGYYFQDCSVVDSLLKRNVRGIVAEFLWLSYPDPARSPLISQLQPDPVWQGEPGRDER